MGALKQTSRYRQIKNKLWIGRICLSAICPSNADHSGTATDRTSGDIVFPDDLYDLCDGAVLKSPAETLLTLNAEDDLQIFRLHTIVQESVVTDPVETGWQHMHEISPDKFRILQSDHTTGFSWPEGSGCEGGLGFRDFDDPAVRDSDLIRVPSQIFDGVSESVKGLFDKRTPVLLVERVPELIPVIGIPEVLAGSRKGKPALLMIRIKEVKILSTELIPKDMDRKKELLL